MPPTTPPSPARKSPRAKFHNYSGGKYFVTICTERREHYFGEIYNDEMHLTAVGRCLSDALKTLTEHYPYAAIPMYVVMPNHLHMLLVIRSYGDAALPPVRTVLSVVVGGLKQSVTLFARRNGYEFGWQGRFHDHIIRGDKDAKDIADYIRTNVSNWYKDCFR